MGDFVLKKMQIRKRILWSRHKLFPEHVLFINDYHATCKMKNADKKW